MRVDLHRLNELSDTTPVLVDLKPTGEGYMEDFHAAGGMPALLWELRDLLHLSARDVTGATLEQRLSEPVFVDRRYIRARGEPVSPVGGLVALFGSLAPRGAILKRSAATPELFETEARAVVFDGLEDLANRIDDPSLDVTEGDIMVLKNAGSLTPAGMPEAGYLPIPQKLARAGVKDMVRMSDCRMSGTAFGTIVLHITPEAAAGGPLGLVRAATASACRCGSVAWTCWSRRTCWTGAAPLGVLLPSPRAAGTASWPSRCCRPMRAAIWRCCGRLGGKVGCRHDFCRAKPEVPYISRSVASSRIPLRCLRPVELDKGRNRFCPQLPDRSFQPTFSEVYQMLLKKQSMRSRK